MFLEKTVQCLNPGGVHTVVYSEFPGDPAKTVICVHGLSRNGRDFDWLAQSLAGDGYRVICPDMPGRGRSAPFSNSEWYNNAQYVADLSTLIAQLGVDQLDWIGTSMGGILGMLTASQPHTLIRKLVLNDIGPFIPSAALGEIKQYVGMNPGYHNWDSYFEAFKKRMASFGLETEEEWEYLARISAAYDEKQKIYLNYDTAIVAGMPPVDQMPDLDLWPFWDHIQVPLLILRGQHSNVLLPETIDRMMVGKQATTYTFPNTGHAPALMSLQQIQTVKDWLNKS